jgi:hypothetical protein
MKFKSQFPSVTPSALVLVRFPLHVILSVEAAFPSTIVPRPSKKMQKNVRHFIIATTVQKVAEIYVILAKRVWWRQSHLGEPVTMPVLVPYR